MTALLEVDVVEPCGPALPINGPEQGVIKEARRRQLRRRLLIAIVALGAGVAAIIAYRGADGGTTSKPPSQPHLRSAATAAAAGPSKLFVQPPGLGVACHPANTIACDRIGLEVWLRRPATAVRATIAGRPVTFDPSSSSPPHNGQRTFFDGFLQRAGIVSQFHVKPDPEGRWYGSDAPSAAVRLWVDYGHGTTMSTEVNAVLTPGFG